MWIREYFKNTIFFICELNLDNEKLIPEKEEISASLWVLYKDLVLYYVNLLCYFLFYFFLCRPNVNHMKTEW